MGVMSTIAESLRQRRRARAMTQRELAERAGVPQPNVSAYESGRRVPSGETLQRLDAALAETPAERLASARQQLLASAEARGLTRVRVFGSFARGDASPTSDVDLLVHPGPESSVFELAGFLADAERMLGMRVDVVSDRGSGPTMDRIIAEAVAL